MKCQRCPKPATLHITEITGDFLASQHQIDELHLCEECAQKHLVEPSAKTAEGKLTEPPGPESADLTELNEMECPHCGVKFKDFRASGRLGCPQDYEVFRAQLVPLLENIHGEVQHMGKTPRRQPRTQQVRSQLAALRKQLQQAVSKEDYEEAASIRDQIKQMETAE